MNKRPYIVIAVAVILAVGGLAVFISNPGRPGSAGQAPTPAVQGPPAVAASPAPVTPPAQYVITYTDSGFSPKTLTVPRGAKVMFENNASGGMWPASNPHPAHNGYPTTGGCTSSTFDACKEIAPGGSWSFIFGIKGSWNYHDHLNAGEGGKVIVP